MTLNTVYQREPNDIAYVHSGYAPLTVRLVSWMTQSLKGLKYVADMVKHLPGPAFQDSQKLSTTQVFNSYTAHSISILQFTKAVQCKFLFP